MKKIICVLLMVAILMTTAACGSTLNGSYVSTGVFPQTFTFSGNQIVMSAFGINASGTYTISDGRIDIKYIMFGEECLWSKPFSRDGDTITIGRTVFVKR